MKRVFKGRAYTVNSVPGAEHVAFGHIIRNSGVFSIALAQRLGGSRVTMLGFDCQQTGGKTHWHGNHPAGMGNAGSIPGNKGRPSWAEQFRQVAGRLHGMPVVNASRVTALTCFPRATLEECLA